MNVTEYRIGNVSQDQKGNILRCVTVALMPEPTVNWYVVDRSKFPLDEGWKAEPILITKDCLSRFGIEESAAGEFIDEIYYYNGTECKFIHRLQNLYFALHAKELLINH